MSRDVWEKPIPAPESPCKKVCVINSQTGYCWGCNRTLREIVEWETASNSEKNLILDRIRERNK